MITLRRVFVFFLAAFAVSLAACGGGGGDTPPPPPAPNVNWDQIQWDRDNWS